MKISIITVCYNSVDTIKDTIESVLSQDYSEIEYVIIDGGSTDGTLEIINSYIDKISIFVSEYDKGIYDALNKGIRMSSGEFIGIMHSDDRYSYREAVSEMVAKLKLKNAEFAFSDMLIVSNNDKIIRYYMAGFFKPWLLRVGWLPPHPTAIIKRTLFDEFGLYSEKFPLAGDFEFFVRVFSGRKIKWTYLNKVTVLMKTGGASNSGFKSKKATMLEINKALKFNRVFSTPLLQIIRYGIRFIELIYRPSKIRH